MKFSKWRAFRWVRNLGIAVGALWIVFKSIVWTGPMDATVASWFGHVLGVLR